MPVARFHSLIVALTVAIMFLVTSWAVPLLRGVPKGESLLAGTVIAVLTSIGIYRMLAIVISAALQRVRWLKKLVFGAYYLEGTWAGFYYISDSSLRWVVEVFEQDFASITIRGTAYTEDGVMTVQWDGQGNLDVKQGTLTALGTARGLSERVTHESIAVYHLKRESGSSPPTVLMGFGADLEDGIRYPTRETKVAGSALSEPETLRQARAFWEAMEIRSSA